MAPPPTSWVLSPTLGQLLSGVLSHVTLPILNASASQGMGGDRLRWTSQRPRPSLMLSRWAGLHLPLAFSSRQDGAARPSSAEGYGKAQQGACAGVQGSLPPTEGSKFPKAFFTRSGESLSLLLHPFIR